MARGVASWKTRGGHDLLRPRRAAFGCGRDHDVAGARAEHGPAPAVERPRSIFVACRSDQHLDLTRTRLPAPTGASPITPSASSSGSSASDAEQIAQDLAVVLAEHGAGRRGAGFASSSRQSGPAAGRRACAGGASTPRSPWRTGAGRHGVARVQHPPGGHAGSASTSGHRARRGRVHSAMRASSSSWRARRLGGEAGKVWRPITRTSAPLGVALHRTRSTGPAAG